MLKRHAAAPQDEEKKQSEVNVYFVNYTLPVTQSTQQERKKSQSVKRFHVDLVGWEQKEKKSRGRRNKYHHQP